VVACLGRTAEKHADEDQPEPTDQGTGEDLQPSQQHQAYRDAAAPVGGASRGGAQVAGAHPQDAAQQPATIEREAGEQIEHAQGDVDEAQVVEHGSPQGRNEVTQPLTDQPEDAPEGQARQRPHHGNEKLRAGIARLAREVRHAAEDKQRDAPHLLPHAVGHEPVRELVDDHRGEEEQRRNQPDAPLLQGVVAGIVVREVPGRQAPQHEHKDHEP
jgi:hypothetical protein